MLIPIRRILRQPPVQIVEYGEQPSPLFGQTVFDTGRDLVILHPSDEKGLMEELLLFVENLDFDGRFITHHTSSVDLNTYHFGKDKNKIIRNLRSEIEHGDYERMSLARSLKTGL